MNNREEILELWSVYSSQVDNITNKRQTINSFYLTIEIAVLGFIITDLSKYGQLFSVIGVFVSVFWLLMIVSYRKLSQAKYDILLKMEQKLLIKPYTEEWNILCKKKYISLTLIEMVTACAFMLGFIILFVIVKFVL